MGLTIKESTFNYEKRDSRYALCLDDVNGADISGVKMIKPADNKTVVKLKNSSDVIFSNSLFYNDVWGNSPSVLPGNKSVEVVNVKLP